MGGGTDVNLTMSQTYDIAGRAVLAKVIITDYGATALQ